jgi:hypothetical protein
VSVLQQLHKPVLLQRLKAQKERAPAARIVAEALTQVGLREEECLDDALVQVGPEAHRLLYALTITEASASASDGRNEESAAPLEPLAAGLLQQLRGVRIGEAVPRGDVCDAAAAALSEMGQLEEERAGLRRQPWEEPWAELEEAAAQLHAGCRRAGAPAGCIRLPPLPPPRLPSWVRRLSHTAALLPAPLQSSSSTLWLRARLPLAYAQGSFWNPQEGARQACTCCPVIGQPAAAGQLGCGACRAPN